MYDKLTQIDINKMQEEMEHRKVVVRSVLLESVKETRAHGDLSENFEYHAAKREKNKNEGRIRYLDKMIKTAVIVQDESKEDEVGLNKTVAVYFEEEQVTEQYKLVTTVRGDSLHGLISIDSPLGKALMGKKIGARVCIHVNETCSYYVIIQEILTCDIEETDQIRSF